MIDNKNGKQYLPQTYEQFLQQKKKTAKTTNFNARPALSLNGNFIPNDSKRTRKEHKPEENDEEVNDCEVTEKVVYSDYQNMLNNFENNKFWEFSNKIETEMIKLKSLVSTKYWRI